MLKEQTVTLPFSPKEYPVPASAVVIIRESVCRLGLPTTIYIANDGELVALTMKPPLTNTMELSGFSVSEMLQKVKMYQEPFDWEPRRDAWVTIYTGPQPPKPVGERVPTLSPAT